MYRCGHCIIALATVILLSGCRSVPFNDNAETQTTLNCLIGVAVSHRTTVIVTNESVNVTATVEAEGNEIHGDE